jgi:Xaa-Pro aminopeptidase
LETGTIGVVGRELDMGAFAGGSLVGVTGPYGISPALFNPLKEKLPSVNFLDGTKVLAAARLVKSDEEIQSMRNAAKVADLCGEAIAEEMTKPGVKEADLWAAYWNTIYRSGGGNSLFFMGFTTSTGNPYDYGAHYYPMDYTLKKGDIFVGELIPEWRDGYAGHLDVSFVLGKPEQPEAYQRMHEICMDCYHELVDSLKPGKNCYEIQERGEKPIIEAGVRRCAPLAYGLGLYGIEPPFVGTPEPFSDGAEDFQLQPGMVLNTIAHIYDEYTKVCVRTGTTHLISETGNECLNNTSFPRGLVSF